MKSIFRTNLLSCAGVITSFNSEGSSKSARAVSASEKDLIFHICSLCVTDGFVDTEGLISKLGVSMLEEDDIAAGFVLVSIFGWTGQGL